MEEAVTEAVAKPEMVTEADIIEDVINSLTNTRNNIEEALNNHKNRVVILDRGIKKEFVHLGGLIRQDIKTLSEMKYPITGSLFDYMKCIPIIEKLNSGRKHLLIGDIA